MPIDIEERYRLIFAEHHYTSDYRFRIVRGWCVMIAALATAFVWAAENAQSLAVIISLAALVITALAWFGDWRNRAAINAVRDVGQDLERAAGVPEKQCFFSKIQSKHGWTHSRALDFFFALVLLSLFGLAVFSVVDSRKVIDRPHSITAGPPCH